MNTATITNISTATPYPFDATSLSFFRQDEDRQVREDQGFYIPKLLTDADYDADPKAYAALEEHAEHLRKAEGLVDDAWNLARLMLLALGDQGDDRAMQIDAGLNVIEKKLNKAHGQIDRFDARYSNLFLAYFDLRKKRTGTRNRFVDVSRGRFAQCEPTF